jgi:ESS family glutamate:Na+ symporter
MLNLNFINTVAFAGIVLFIGYGIRRVIPSLSRYNIPAPVIGGLLVALINLLARKSDIILFQFDVSLQSPLMIAFFTCIGFGASLALLKRGGLQVIILLAAATFFAIVQNAVGIMIAGPLGVHPLFGVISGSVTLAGGPATGLAFAPLFEQAGVHGAASVAVASAMVGIISASLLGGPIATYLIDRNKLKIAPVKQSPVATNVVEEGKRNPPGRIASDEKKTSYALMKGVVAILVAMWIGSWISQGVAAIGVTLPAYIGAMLVAALFRNLDDATNVCGFSQRVIDDIGIVALSLFIVMALMTLKLWELAGLALPLLLILIAQVVLMSGICIWPMFKLMGRDYDSAVISSGFCGFMLGTTANAMANMETLVERYGPAPRAFLVVPMVGAFFVDFTNAIIITACLNIWR